MPLEILPDRFGEAKHEELDKAVNEATQDFSTFSAQKMLPFHSLKYLLASIVDTSDGELDPKFAVPRAAETLINTYDDVRDMLLSAWECKSYSKIRNLAILAAPGSVPKSSRLAVRDEHQILSIPFKGEYHGAAVNGLYEYLTYNEKSFWKDRYYAKFCSIVQSSGTGKSRMLTELGNKDVITIYMNLRDIDDKLSFPPRDRIPSSILTRFPSSERAYMADCYAFFIGLFRTVEEFLSTSQGSSSARENVMRWVRQMCDMSDPPESTVRNDFFEKLDANYGKAHGDLLAINKQLSESPGASSIPKVDKTEVKDTNRDIDKTTQQFTKLFISGPDEKDRLLPELELSQLLHGSFLRMVDSLDSIFPKPWTGPKLVIAIDEAHPLSAAQRDYRPADVFCRVVKEYSHIGPKDHGVWVVFASTTSRVTDFSPPNKIHNSHRIANRGEKLFPPYTQLGWDQSAPPLGTVDLENVSLAKNIVGFGRPLWQSLKSTTADPSKVLDTALEKLCGTQYDPRKTDQVLAVIGQRFSINVTFGHPDSVEHLENGVASHLRVCLATTLDRTWRFTSYPSEPFLSCVAATILHRAAQSLDKSLEEFLNLVNAGMIDMGQRGELASRLLWLLAKDLFIRTRQGAHDAFPSEWDQHLVDCQMIPVVDWLEFIFGPGVWNKEVRETFTNAYINFSHWVCMGTNIAGSKQGEELPLSVWTLRHWQRTSAVQCCHQQPLIDKVIPIYFKGGPGSAKEQMSQIFISDRARKSRDSKLVLHAITRRDKSISGAQQSDSELGSLPYIAILADLSWDPSSFSVTFPERDVSDRCLRIYAAGVDKTAYPFLANYPALQQALENLVHPKKVPDAKRNFSKYLDAQVKFGSTATAEHMEWERGRRLPPSQVGK